MTDIISVKNLSKSYGSHQVLSDVSFSFEGGQIIGLLGPNGSGKTSLIKILTGLIHDYSGEVLIDGNKPGKVSKAEVAYLPEKTYLADWMRSIDAIEYMADFYADFDKEKALRMLEGFQLPPKQKIKTMSKGMQEKLQLLLVMSRNAKLYVLDEPLGALDLRLRKDMQNELKNIQQRMGITFIYVTHDQEEALTMSDTIVVMNKGKIQQIGRPEDIYNEPKNAFVADFIGESNILDGVMLEDYVVKFFGRKFQCVDKGFAPNEPVDVVIRPEDVDIVPPEQGHLCGTVTSVTFKGVHYDTIVDFKGFKWLIQTTDYCPVDAYIGIRLNPEDIHIMHKSEYSGLYGDYSSYSAEYDEIADASEEEADEE